MSEVTHSATQYTSKDLKSNKVLNCISEYDSLKEPGLDFGSSSDVSNRMEKSDSMANDFSDNTKSLYSDNAKPLYPDSAKVMYGENGNGLYQDSAKGMYQDKGLYGEDAKALYEEGSYSGESAQVGDQAVWQSSGYMSMSQDGLRQMSEEGLRQMSEEGLRHNGESLGYAQPFELGGGLVGGYGADSGLLHQKLLEAGQDSLQGHSLKLSMENNSMPEPPRRMLSKGRKNKDEANELVRRAKLLPKVMGVRYDANHQYWVATWYQNRKRMDRYFSVGRFGFEEARLLAIDCRKTAGKSLQGKSYDRPSYSKEGKSRSYDSVDKHGDYYAADDMSKKSKDFNRLNVSKVALNYILSDLCNNCLPTILENNHMPGELYIHCYNKISDHLQMIITASQSEEIEKYLHLFQLCIQNRVLPSALQVQEQRAMITTLCQM